MKCGDRVLTGCGTGTIVDKDLPESSWWRWIVKIDDEFSGCVWNYHSESRLAFFPNELKHIPAGWSKDHIEELEFIVSYTMNHGGYVERNLTPILEELVSWKVLSMITSADRKNIYFSKIRR